MRRLATLAVVAALMSATARAETLDWIQQLGTSEEDASKAVSADGLGNVYISGLTRGSLGETHAGDYDAFISKYDVSGTLEWTRQIGSSHWDISHGVSADGLGDIYISGYTKFDLGGPHVGEDDVFISKYDASGALEWTQHLGTSTRDVSYSVSADGLGSVYISGYTRGSLGVANAGSLDAFLSKYDASGTLKWTQQLGTSSSDVSYGVSADGLGSVYISGYTGGILGGTNAGEDDVFISKYDASGALKWTQQLGTGGDDVSYGVSADGLGSVYISGAIERNPSGGIFTSGDAFLAKFTDLLLGDVNLDGVVNGLDVDPFVEVLLSGPYQPEADMNEDQVVNGLDVDPFVAAVVGGTQPVPEPSTLILLALGVIGAWRKWGG